MKILELFSGYGTASFALKQLGIPYDIIGYSDIDKYANQCFRQNHCPVDMDRMLGDVTKVNPNDLDDFDLLTGGFPCQTFSIAGKGLGELDTRGTLFNEIIRIAEVKKPKYMLLENVKGLLSKKHEQTFNKILSELARIGYFIHWGLYNTKEYGIPQNRNRVFFICFRDHKEFMSFAPPKKEELKIFLKDILEEEVDEKYYLKDYTVKRLLNNGQGFRSKINPEVGSCLFASMHKVSRGMDIICINPRKEDGTQTYQQDRIYSSNGVLPAISSQLGGRFNIQHNTIFRKLTPKECFRLQGFLNDEVNLEGLSNTQRYKLVGNGQSVNVVKNIFENMFNCSPNLNKESQDGNMS